MNVKSSLVYILTFTPSFVNNEINALRNKGINVKVVMLGQPEQPGQKGWSYITGGIHDPIYISDQNKLFKRLFIFPLNLVNIFLKAKVKDLLSVFKMIFYSSYSKSLAFYHSRKALEVIRIISKYKPYRIHSHFAWGNAFVAAYTAQLLEIPFSLTVHASDIFALNKSAECALKSILNRADTVITISKFNKNYLITKGLCIGDKIEVIHCGVPISKFNYNERPYQKGTFRIVTIPSGFVETKGLKVLIGAVKNLIEVNEDIECYIIGDGKDREKYEQEVKKLGLSSFVKFLGRIPQVDLPELYKKCHAFILPCITDERGKPEGIPVSLMEAMAVGLPVISTALAGIPELIEDEKQGLLSKPGDVQSLVCRIKRQIEEPAKSVTMAISARAKIEADFNINTIAEKLIKTLSLH